MSDKVLDLRSCKFPGASFKAIVLSGALMSGSDFSGANMQARVSGFWDRARVDGKHGKQFTSRSQSTLPFRPHCDTSRDPQEVVLSKAYAVGANFEGADMSNAVVDRTDLSGSNLKGVRFYNTVITGTNFNNADLTGADFEDALIGFEDAKRLCALGSGACSMRSAEALSSQVVHALRPMCVQVCQPHGAWPDARRRWLPRVQVRFCKREIHGIASGLSATPPAAALSCATWPVAAR